MLRIGLLTSGGDCQALNATMRGIVKTLINKSKEPVEIYGFENGYQGLIYGRYRRMTAHDFSGILTRGGTILGTSRTPFKRLDIPEADGVEKVPAMIKTYKSLELDCLFMLGGNGSTKTANRLREEGLNVIALPKTIDNDTWGTDMTFGFTSAVEIATKCIDDIHTTASSHGRVFVIEIMGHKVGWIPLYAGVAGGADVILIPEIPYDMKNVIATIEKRMKTGSRFTIIAVAEGAISKQDAKLSKKEYKKKVAERTSPSIVYDIAREIEEKTGRETRVAIPGHTQRGGAWRARSAVSTASLASWSPRSTARCAAYRSRRSPASSSTSTPRAILCARPRRSASASATSRRPSAHLRPCDPPLSPPHAPQLPGHEGLRPQDRAAPLSRVARSCGPTFFHARFFTAGILTLSVLDALYLTQQRGKDSHAHRRSSPAV